MEGTGNILKLATEYYKDLFGPAPGNVFAIDQDMWDGSKKNVY